MVDGPSKPFIRAQVQGWDRAAEQDGAILLTWWTAPFKPFIKAHFYYKSKAGTDQPSRMAPSCSPGGRPL